MRVTDRSAMLTPSMETYAEYVRSTGVQTDRFLECVIHDSGAGIARHFAAANRLAYATQGDDGEPFSEWLALHGAFERHATSKPVGFVNRTTDPYATPGVGLAGLLTALKRIRGYLEVRTGRLRVWQWYRDEHIIPNSKLVRPYDLPDAAPRIRGTIVRVLVPLPASGS